VVLALACHRVATYHCLDSCQVSDLGHEWIQDLIFASSAPGKLPPPLPRNTNGTGSGTRYDAVKVYDIVSEAHRDVLNTFNVVSDIHRNMLKGQEGTDGQHRSVSDARS